MTSKEDPEKVLHAFGWHDVVIPQPSQTFYAITGHESQVVTIRLAEGDEGLQGEPGTMFFLTPGMKQTVDCAQCCQRCCTGESCCMVHFHNTNSGTDGYAALTPNFPTAKVVPVDLSSPHVNGSLIAQTGSYMASYGDVRISASFDCNFVRCCCGGLGLIRQRLMGSGTVFLSSTGTMVQKVLGEGEVILVDTNCVMAFAESCKLDLKRTGGVLGMIGGGEGIFNTTLTGPGLVIIQSMNEVVFKQAIAAQKILSR